MIRRPPRSTLFPSPTLFRSSSTGSTPRAPSAWPTTRSPASPGPSSTSGPPPRDRADRHDHAVRSEEHTSELQSRQYLVCRLLLEKKKKTSTASCKFSIRNTSRFLSQLCTYCIASCFFFF